MAEKLEIEVIIGADGNVRFETHGLRGQSCLAETSGLEKALGRVREGMKELDLAAEIDYQMRRMGAEQPAFETIVAAGGRAALPQFEPRRVGERLLAAYRSAGKS